PEIRPACPETTPATFDGPAIDWSPCQRSFGTARGSRTTSATPATCGTTLPIALCPPRRDPRDDGGTPTSANETPSAPPSTVWRTACAASSGSTHQCRGP